MNNIWFASDHHFGHNNILDYCGRPYDTIEDHDEDLIKRHNELVGPNEVVYFLGDVTFKKTPDKLYHIFPRLNGRITLIRGNHDYWAKDRKGNKDKALELFPNLEEIVDYKEVRIDKTRLVLMHYPIETWNHRSIHLHGHTHNFNKVSAPGRIHVGVDAHNYYPVHIDEIFKLAKGLERDRK